MQKAKLKDLGKKITVSDIDFGETDNSAGNYANVSNFNLQPNETLYFTLCLKKAADPKIVGVWAYKPISSIKGDTSGSKPVS